MGARTNTGGLVTGIDSETAKERRSRREDCEDGESDVPSRNECALIDGSGVYGWFEMKTGV